MSFFFLAHPVYCCVLIVSIGHGLCTYPATRVCPVSCKEDKTSM